MSSSRLEGPQADPPAADVQHARSRRQAREREEARVAAGAGAGGEGEARRASGPRAVA